MNIDIRTLSFIIGITNCILAAAIVIQYRLNKVYEGSGWWALGCVSLSAGFMITILRDRISVIMVSIVFGNTLLIAGLVFLYTGISRFLHKKENRAAVFLIISVYLLLTLYTVFVITNEYARTFIFYSTVVILVYMVSFKLFRNRNPSVSSSSWFTAAIFFCYGSFLLFRIIFTGVTDHDIYIFSQSTIQLASFMATLIASILWTFGFIIMQNQQLNAESGEYLRAVIDSVNDAVFIHNENGDIIDVNSRMCEMYGYTPDEARTVSIGEISQGCPPYSQDDALAWLGKAMVSGPQTFEWKSKRKNGEIFSSEVSIRFVNAVGKNYCVVTEHDLSDRKKFEEELTRIKKAVETASNAIWITDRKAEMVVYNNRSFAELFKYTAEELNRKGGSAALYPDPMVAKAVYNRVKNHGSFTTEVALRTGDGRELLINLYADVVKDDSGKPTAYMGIATDITEKKQTEAELIESRQRLADIIQFFPDPIIVIDREGKVTSWNRAIELLTGVPAAEMIGRGDYEYSIPFYGERKPILIDYALNIDKEPDGHYSGFERNGNLITGEAYMPSLRGGQAYLYGTATALYNPMGELTGAIESIRDISERKKFEEELTRIKKAVEVSSNAIWLTDRRAEKVIYNNIAFTRLFMSTGDEINNSGGPADLFVLRETARGVYNSLRSDRSWSGEVMMKTGDGRELFIYLYADVVKDEAGNHIAYIGIATDITEKKHIETELIESRQRMSDIIQFFPDPVLVIDNEGRVVAWNRAIEELTGVRAADMIGKGNYEYSIPFYGERRPLLVDLVLKSEPGTEGKYNEFRRTGKLVEAEVHIPDLRGEEVYLTGVAIALYNPHGEIVGAIESIRNVTERKKMEEELLKAQKLESIGLIAGGIAHDFNNILTGIIGYISLIRKIARSDDRVNGMLAEVEKASSRATNLTQQLLTFSKGWAPVRKTVLVNELLKESAAFVLSGSNIRCNFTIQDGLWPVEIDEGQIIQVINNLIINARQAMPEGGIIEISAENCRIDSVKKIPLKEGSYVMIAVSDQGTGIPPEIQSRIFDPFFTTKATGNGLGLSTSYSIIRKHDGYLKFRSEPGEGAAFYVYLPASDKLTGFNGKKNEMKSYSLKGRVLLMDDEDIIRKTAGEMLSFMGLEADSAADGTEALGMFIRAAESGNPYDLVIMDLTVPGGQGGKEAIKRFREIDPLIKVIASSGYSNDPIMSDYRRYGFSGIIGKPYKVDDLYDEMKKVFELK
jgi:PAS domain S-box-containing protein